MVLNIKMKKESASSKFGKNSHSYAVIMAGGSGTRLWPVSKAIKPKQFQSLIGSQSLLQTNYSLLSNTFDTKHIFIQCPGQYVNFINEQLPQITEKQLIIEPEARDTGPAFAFAAISLIAHDKDASIGVFYADNLVQDSSANKFHDAIKLAFEAVDQVPNHLIMIGVRPLYAHTGLGYIEMGSRRTVNNTLISLFETKSFVEKPPTHVARKFTKSGSHLWNTGYKVLKAQHLLNLLINSSKIYAEIIPKLHRALKKRNAQEVSSSFAILPKNSFEYLVTEKTENLLVMPVDIAWSDVGDWEIIHNILSQEKDGKMFTAGNVTQHECENTLLLSHHRPIIALGANNLIVVETKDAVLIMSKERSQEIKIILKELMKKSPELI